MIFSALGLASAGVTLPGTLELALLTAGGLLPAKRPGPAIRSLRKIGVVVPAHNEELGIERCVHSLLSAHKPAAELLVTVVADNCTDRTAEIARSAGANVLERFSETERGKGFALEFAFETLFEAHEDLDAVLVVDADTEVASNFLLASESWFQQGSEAVQCRYTVRNADESDRTRLMNVALMAFNVLRPRGRSRWGLSAGILGNGFGLTRTCLERVPYSARSVVEDLEHHLNLVRADLKVDFIDETWVKADFPTGESGSDTQRARWEGGRMRMLKDHAPALAAEVAKGNLSMTEPLLDLLLLPLATHVGLLGATLAIPAPLSQLYAGAGLSVVAAHVAAALKVGGAEAGDIKAVLRAPLYIAWKAKLIPQILQNAQEETEWVRTAREA